MFLPRAARKVKTSMRQLKRLNPHHTPDVFHQYALQGLQYSVFFTNLQICICNVYYQYVMHCWLTRKCATCLFRHFCKGINIYNSTVFHQYSQTDRCHWSVSLFFHLSMHTLWHKMLHDISHNSAIHYLHKTYICVHIILFLGRALGSFLEDFLKKVVNIFETKS